MLTLWFRLGLYRFSRNREADKGWFRLGLYRFSRNREADKGKNKGKKTGQNEITPGSGTKEICGFM